MAASSVRCRQQLASSGAGRLRCENAERVDRFLRHTRLVVVCRGSDRSEHLAGHRPWPGASGPDENAGSATPDFALRHEADPLARDDALREEDVQFRGDRFELHLVRRIGHKAASGTAASG